MAATCPLLTLPGDVLLNILLFLSLPDILVVGQLCRGLHEYTLNSDYLWHQLLRKDPSNLPLDVEPYVDQADIPATMLQKVVTRGLRLDHNWRRSNPRIKALIRIGGMDNVSQMQLIGSDWLVVLRRSPSSLSVWRVVDTKRAFRTAFIDLPDSTVPLKFAATMHRQCRELSIALISATKSGTLLSAYSIPLNPQVDDSSAATFNLASPRVICNICRPETDGQFYEVHIHSHLIAVGIHSVLPPVYRILFINSLTAVQCLVDPEWPEQVTQFHFKVYPRHLVLTGVRSQSTLVVRIHDLPPAMSRSATANSSSLLESVSLIESLAAPVAEYESPTISDLDYTLCADSTRNVSHISSISFHSLIRRADDYIFHFPLVCGAKWLEGSAGTGKPSFIHRFSTHTSASAEIVCLGETGSRAVWLERRWTSDEYTLMKGTFSPNRGNPVVVEPLLARHLALPFELRMCQALAFEESTGRVCVAVHSGELYILEF
ncbi:hypothetical protein GGX14DRAFT_418416 [Mycena pura]|uniref:F-box domain-containing protein n=1 Tax=Mycena pura TaxID=153505 RepID=A0AAD6YRG3_9AGAR|nr:hypothetical protein GGX14DRAFT_418416 [Mycena pura]